MTTRRRPLAVLVATLSLVGAGLLGGELAAPASAGHGTPPGPVRGVTVHRFVQRDATGHITGRGATATRGSGPAVRPVSARAGGARTVTLRRGQQPVVRRSGPAPRTVPVVATRP